MGLGEKEHEATVVESSGEQNEKKKKGLLWRIWHGLFRVKGDDFEKRLEGISKEEASIRSRMKRRSATKRKLITNLIAFSLFFEVIAVSYAIVTTRDEDLDWRLRSLRVLPMFLLPALASLGYSSLVSFTTMCDRRDQKTLEKLQGEMLGKIDELKERTNYFTTLDILRRFDPDPAARAAAATILASKLGADSGLKVVYVGDESQLDPTTTGKSSDIEVKHSQGLRNRKQPNTRRSHSAGTTPSHHSGTTSTKQNQQNQQMVFEHYNPRGYAGHDGSWISRIAALLVAEDPTQSCPLICGNCHMHNGLCRKEDFSFVTYYCPHCQAMNKPKHSIVRHADTVSLKPIKREVVNSSSSTSERGRSPRNS